MNSFSAFLKQLSIQIQQFYSDLLIFLPYILKTSNYYDKIPKLNGNRVKIPGEPVIVKAVSPAQPNPPSALLL